MDPTSDQLRRQLCRWGSSPEGLDSRRKAASLTAEAPGHSVGSLWPSQGPTEDGGQRRDQPQLLETTMCVPLRSGSAPRGLGARGRRLPAAHPLLWAPPCAGGWLWGLAKPMFCPTSRGSAMAGPGSPPCDLAVPDLCVFRLTFQLPRDPWLCKSPPLQPTSSHAREVPGSWGMSTWLRALPGTWGPTGAWVQDPGR